MSDPTSPPPTDPAAPQTPPLTGEGQPDILMCVLSYLGILAIVPLVAKKDDPFVQFHARQGIALFAAWIVVAIILIIVSVILGFIHWTLSTLMSLVLLALMIGVLVLTIMGIVKACGGERWLMPVIGPSVNKAG